MKVLKPIYSLSALFLLLASAAWNSSCVRVFDSIDEEPSSGASSKKVASAPASSNKAPSGAAQAKKPSAPGPSPVDVAKNRDLEKLAKLWKERTQEKTVTDYPIGTGDVLEISVPAIEELRGRVVRVSGDGTIALPFVGKIYVTGMTEEQLREQLTSALKKYMYEPRVGIFVKEYRSRQVAVLGSVFKPGLYSMNSGGDTILDMLSQAGGITSGADPRLYFIPAESVGGEGQVQKIAASLSDPNIKQDPGGLLSRADPILVDLKELALGGYQHYLSLAVRPGDLIIVPGGGQILVEGWVEKPGAFNMTPGMTVTGIVAAAGGLLYPADDNSVRIIRNERGGKRSVLTADLVKIKKGEASDISLQGGDIVEVAATTSRLVPYGVYQFLSSIIKIGIGGTIPIAGS
jgi:polysaccharide export outer membrane protein